MTAQVIKFNSKNKKSVKKDKRNEIDIIIDDWYNASKTNNLSNFIKSKLPSFALSEVNSDFVNDLNAIAFAEQKLKMKFIVFCPEASIKNPNGWMTMFFIKEQLYSTPPNMPSEALARSLGLLIFSVLSRNF